MYLWVKMCCLQVGIRSKADSSPKRLAIFQALLPVAFSVINPILLAKDGPATLYLDEGQALVRSAYSC